MTGPQQAWNPGGCQWNLKFKTLSYQGYSDYLRKFTEIIITMPYKACHYVLEILKKSWNSGGDLALLYYWSLIQVHNGKHFKSIK